MTQCNLVETLITGGFVSAKMETVPQKLENPSDNFTKTPVPISKSPSQSPSIRNMTRTVIVSLAETVTHDITYGELPPTIDVNIRA